MDGRVQTSIPSYHQWQTPQTHGWLAGPLYAWFESLLHPGGAFYTPHWVLHLWLSLVPGSVDEDMVSTTQNFPCFHSIQWTQCPQNPSKNSGKGEGWYRTVIRLDLSNNWGVLRKTQMWAQGLVLDISGTYSHFSHFNPDHHLTTICIQANWRYPLPLIPALTLH